MKTFTVEEAQRQLGEILDMVSRGEHVTIEFNGKLYGIYESIPEAPPGYFDDIYDEEYIKECNECAKHSVIRVPHDLE